MIYAWIEQSYYTSSTRVMGINAITFVQIAVRAGIAKVRKLSLASKYLRHNMINVECLGSDDLRCVAIFATVACTFCHPTRQSSRQVGHKMVTD